MVAVCSPALLGRRRNFSAQAIAQLPLIQQSTRPDAWPAWFEAMQVEAPLARVGPRYELFSMACAAAAHGMGVALVPRQLIETELAHGALVLAHPAPLPSQRHYFLIYPEQTTLPPSVQRFRQWLQDTAP